MLTVGALVVGALGHDVVSEEAGLARPGVRDQRFAGGEAQDVRLCGRAGLPVAGELCGRRVDQGVAGRSVAADVAGEVGLVDRAAQRASKGLRAVLTQRINVCTLYT